MDTASTYTDKSARLMDSLPQAITRLHKDDSPSMTTVEKSSLSKPSIDVGQKDRSLALQTFLGNTDTF